MVLIFVFKLKHNKFVLLSLYSCQGKSLWSYKMLNFALNYLWNSSVFMVIRPNKNNAEVGVTQLHKLGRVGWKIYLNIFCIVYYISLFLDIIAHNIIATLCFVMKILQLQCLILPERCYCMIISVLPNIDIKNLFGVRLASNICIFQKNAQRHQGHKPKIGSVRLPQPNHNFLFCIILCLSR